MYTPAVTEWLDLVVLKIYSSLSLWPPSFCVSRQTHKLVLDFCQLRTTPLKVVGSFPSKDAEDSMKLILNLEILRRTRKVPAFVSYVVQNHFVRYIDLALASR